MNIYMCVCVCVCVYTYIKGFSDDSGSKVSAYKPAFDHWVRKIPSSCLLEPSVCGS